MPPKRAFVDENYAFYLNELQSLSLSILTQYLSLYKPYLQRFVARDVSVVIQTYCDNSIADLVNEYIGNGEAALNVTCGYGPEAVTYSCKCRLITVSSTHLFVAMVDSLFNILPSGKALQLTAFAEMPAPFFRGDPFAFRKRRERIKQPRRKLKLLFHPKHDWMQENKDLRLFFGSVLFNQQDDWVTELPAKNAQLEFLLRRSNAMLYEW